MAAAAATERRNPTESNEQRVDEQQHSRGERKQPDACCRSTDGRGEDGQCGDRTSPRSTEGSKRVTRPNSAMTATDATSLGQSRSRRSTGAVTASTKATFCPDTASRWVRPAPRKSSAMREWLAPIVADHQAGEQRAAIVGHRRRAAFSSRRRTRWPRRRGPSQVSIPRSSTPRCAHRCAARRATVRRRPSPAPRRCTTVAGEATFEQRFGRAGRHELDSSTGDASIRRALHLRWVRDRRPAPPRPGHCPRVRRRARPGRDLRGPTRAGRRRDRASAAVAAEVRRAAAPRRGSSGSGAATSGAGCRSGSQDEHPAVGHVGARRAREAGAARAWLRRFPARRAAGRPR